MRPGATKEERSLSVRAALEAGVPAGDVVRALFDAGLRVVDVVPPFMLATGLGLSHVRAVVDPVARGEPFRESFPGQYRQAMHAADTLAGTTLLRSLVLDAIHAAARWLTLSPDGDGRTSARHGDGPDAGRLVTYDNRFESVRTRLDAELRLVACMPWVRRLTDEPNRILLQLPQVPEVSR